MSREINCRYGNPIIVMLLLYFVQYFRNFIHIIFQSKGIPKGCRGPPRTSLNIFWALFNFTLILLPIHSIFPVPLRWLINKHCTHREIEYYNFSPIMFFGNYILYSSSIVFDFLSLIGLIITRHTKFVMKLPVYHNFRYLFNFWGPLCTAHDGYGPGATYKT